MISFKAFLQEKAFNKKSAIQAVAKNPGTLVGFEFEFAVPGQEDVEEPETMYVDDLRDWADIEKWFGDDSRTLARIWRDYERWVEETESDWVDEEWEGYFDAEDENDSEEDAREKAAKEFQRTTKFEWEDWVIDRFDGIESMIAHYGLDPNFGWHDSSRSGSFYTEDTSVGSEEAVVQAVAENLSKYLGVNVHGTLGKYDASKRWVVTTDSSVEGGTPIEIISPPMPYDAAVDALKKVLSFAKIHEFETNDTTGLHMNLSVPGITEIDPVKLVLFLGENYALNMFDRVGNRYAKEHSELLSALEELDANDPQLLNKIEDFAPYIKKFLQDDKYRTINLGKLLNGGYLEFRIAGGDYLENANVTPALERFIIAIDLAMDPSAARNEYYKKLVKAMNSTRPDESTKSALEIEAKKAHLGMASLDVLKYHIDKNASEAKLYAIAAQLLAYLARSKKPLPTKAKIDLVKLLKSGNLSLAGLRSQTDFMPLPGFYSTPVGNQANMEILGLS